MTVNFQRVEHAKPRLQTIASAYSAKEVIKYRDPHARAKYEITPSGTDFYYVSEITLTASSSRSISFLEVRLHQRVMVTSI